MSGAHSVPALRGQDTSGPKGGRGREETPGSSLIVRPALLADGLSGELPSGAYDPAVQPPPRHKAFRLLARVDTPPPARPLQV
jgi:hypothetical protein